MCIVFNVMWKGYGHSYNQFGLFCTEYGVRSTHNTMGIISCGVLQYLAFKVGVFDLRKI
jgi:hypothetical protein